MKLVIREEFKNDYITRDAGERLRQMLVASIQAKRNIELDFKGLMVASTSFFDEGVAKLAEEGIHSEALNKYILFNHLHPRDSQLLRDLCGRRGLIINSPNMNS